jgi:hypothetical protein
MIKLSLSTTTVTPYLPAELKAKPRGFQVSNAKSVAIRAQEGIVHS